VVIALGTNVADLVMKLNAVEDALIAAGVMA